LLQHDQRYESDGYNKENTKRASYIINLFLADLPHTNASTN